LYGYRLISWDGKSYNHKLFIHFDKGFLGIKPLPLLDDTECMFMIFAGRLDDQECCQSCDELYGVLEKLGNMTDLLAECLNHQHGHYAVFDSGITHGPGSTTITNTVLSSF
jgi:hypothetical protein